MSGAPGHLDVAVVGKANLDYLVLGPRLPKPGMSAGGDVFHEGREARARTRRSRRRGWGRPWR